MAKQIPVDAVDVEVGHIARVEKFLKRIKRDPYYELVSGPEWYITEYNWPTKDDLHRILKCKIIVVRVISRDKQERIVYRYHSVQKKWYTDGEYQGTPAL